MRTVGTASFEGVACALGEAGGAGETETAHMAVVADSCTLETGTKSAGSWIAESCGATAASGVEDVEACVGLAVVAARRA